jgi:hypothetical protein
MSRRYRRRLARFVHPELGQNSLPRTSESGTPTRKAMRVPTLPEQRELDLELLDVLVVGRG